MEMLMHRLMNIGYTQEQALDLIDMYEQNNKIAELEDYVLTKELLRGDL